MLRAYDVVTVRTLESALMARLPEGALMERAAAGLSSAIVDVLGGAYGARIVLLVGSGDNGGDALLAGSMLARRGARVDALLLSDREHRHVATLRAAGGYACQADDVRAASLLTRADVVVDGIVGIGGTGGLREPAAALVQAIPADAVVVAVDLPSGVDADTGVVNGSAVDADVTVCMGVLKPGLLIDPGAARVGAVRLIDIGLSDVEVSATVEALTDADVETLIGSRDRRSDKYSGGVVGIVAGSAAYPGAAVLSVAGALASGAGYVRFVGDPEVVHAVRSAFPEVVCQVASADGGVVDWAAALSAAGRVQSWVVGPGAGIDAPAHDRVAAVLNRPEPVLLDADALTCLADDTRTSGVLTELVRGREAATLLTPHAGELARLLDESRETIEAHRLASVTRAADGWDVTVLLKGSTTLVSDPVVEGRRSAVRANTTGTVALATAGSGDVLSGLAGALLARGLSARDAASVAAHLHGLAGQRAALMAGGSRAITASRIAAALGLDLAETDPEDSAPAMG